MKGAGSCSLGVGSEGTEIGWGFRTNRASGRGKMDGDGCKRPSGLKVREEELSCSPLEERRGSEPGCVLTRYLRDLGEVDLGLLLLPEP